MCPENSNVIFTNVSNTASVNDLNTKCTNRTYFTSRKIILNSTPI